MQMKVFNFNVVTHSYSPNTISCLATNIRNGLGFGTKPIKYFKFLTKRRICG